MLTQQTLLKQQKQQWEDDISMRKSAANTRMNACKHSNHHCNASLTTIQGCCSMLTLRLRSIASPASAASGAFTFSAAKSVYCKFFQLFFFGSFLMRAPHG